MHRDAAVQTSSSARLTPTASVPPAVAMISADVPMGKGCATPASPIRPMSAPLPACTGATRNRSRNSRGMPVKFGRLAGAGSAAGAGEHDAFPGLDLDIRERPNVEHAGPHLAADRAASACSGAGACDASVDRSVPSKVINAAVHASVGNLARGIVGADIVRRAGPLIKKHTPSRPLAHTSGEGEMSRSKRLWTPTDDSAGQPRANPQPLKGIRPQGTSSWTSSPPTAPLPGRSSTP